MNPHDLLNTNKFVGTTDIEFNNNKFSRDRINILKTIDTPFPKKYNRNWEPIISDEIRDVVKNRYKKYKITALTIDSQDRNFHIYPKSNDYNVILNNQFNNVHSISLIGINFYNIFLTKTKITWMLSPLEGNIYSIEIPYGIYNNKKLEETMMNYMNTQIDNNNKLQNIHINIDPYLNEINIINRIQSLDIISIQTINNNDNDIFRSFSSNPPSNYSQEGIYILIKGELDMTKPIIPTNIKDINVFSNILFNFKEFWFGNNMENEISFIDNIILNNIIYYRYLLIPKLNNKNLITNKYENIILKKSIELFLINQMIYDFNLCENDAKIGEGREFLINYEESNIMEIFGWYECENEFRFIHSNNSIYNINKNKCFYIYKNECCEYIFIDEPYILLKLSTTSLSDDKIAGNLVKSQNIKKNKKICECDIYKGDKNIFAKIDIKNNITFDSSILKFYDTPLEKLNQLHISFINRFGCLTNIICDHTLTFEIIETIDVLKDTLIDSRHGEVNITGIRN
jgi:hypothetical protein